MTDLASILAAILDEADAIERSAAAPAFSVARVRQMVADIKTAGPEFLTWLSEKEAMARSGWKQATLMSKYAAWEAQGYARKNPDNLKERQYLAVKIELRESLDDVRAQARRAAEAAVLGAHEGKRA